MLQSGASLPPEGQDKTYRALIEDDGWHSFHWTTRLLILPPGEPPEGGFYGWLWYYIGGHQDPRHAGEHPELREKVFIPDVLLQSHSASLEMTFYTGAQFPREYVNDAFACEHGSWNRSVRTGYKLIRVPLRDGTSSGLYEDFMTGFVTPEGNVWGRPVGVTVTKEGAFLVTDDGANMIWRISYVGR